LSFWLLFGQSLSRSQHAWPIEDDEDDYEPAKNNLIPFPVSRSIDELEDLSASLETMGSGVTPVQLLGIVLRVALKNRITEEEIDRICTSYYNAVMSIWVDE
jgi:hypothetical protein